MEVASAKRLRSGDLVRTPVGQAFAVDGAATDGSTQADESPLTGESRPVVKATGDAVVVGCKGCPSERTSPSLRSSRVGAGSRRVVDDSNFM